MTQGQSKKDERRVNQSTLHTDYNKCSVCICHIPPAPGMPAVPLQPHHQSPVTLCSDRAMLYTQIPTTFTWALAPSTGLKSELQLFFARQIYCHVFRRKVIYLSWGLSTYFLNCLTLLRVCSANSLEGSMIRALGALDDAFTWLTLALPAQKEKRKKGWACKGILCWGCFMRY